MSMDLTVTGMIGFTNTSLTPNFHKKHLKGRPSFVRSLSFPSQSNLPRSSEI